MRLLPTWNSSHLIRRHLSSSICPQGGQNNYKRLPTTCHCSWSFLVNKFLASNTESQLVLAYDSFFSFGRFLHESLRTTTNNFQSAEIAYCCDGMAKTHKQNMQKFWTPPLRSVNAPRQRNWRKFLAYKFAKFSLPFEIPCLTSLVYSTGIRSESCVYWTILTLSKTAHARNILLMHVWKRSFLVFFPTMSQNCNDTSFNLNQQLKHKNKKLVLSCALFEPRRYGGSDDRSNTTFH